jgi:transcriptional regulator with XRE-family HTH domain
LRIQKGISQKEFAELVNLHPVQYNRYEKGETIPTTETLAKLADALGVSVDYLYDGTEEDAAVANLEDIELLKLFKEIENFNQEEKNHVKFILDSVVKNKKLKQLAS